MNTAGLIITALVSGLALLCFSHYWIYHKGKQAGDVKATERERKECNERLIKVHNLIASGTMPDGMRESNKVWGLPSDSTPCGVVPSNTDVH